ncbi:hypothetical protein Aeqsu_2918 [Aequorivita sublithincola DSM 14238]|uniref:Uncharacterized protein n=1 Tax=Aequorivita sublithincola (strain DSM 14238 / LMG 21431 / ACAM 643 / 9-3) TaxID=746697 RepID=I3YZE1_AEQSU|nr:hypothetical protein [Aequorivita sublithincola]AFL82359.1 hypothetical protein Aeqsu_2918 [Aequorivita sublithincola DSM 14238]
MDIFTIRYLRHSLHIDIFYLKKERKINGFFNVLKLFLKSIFSGKIYLQPKNENEHLFYFGSPNQYNALKNIYKSLKQNSIVCYQGNDVRFSDEPSFKFPFWQAYLNTLLSYPFIFKISNEFTNRFFSANKYVSYSRQIAYSLGAYETCLKILKKSKPKYVWLSNDHSTINVAFLYAAKKLKVKTIYLQHASVSPKFPKLTFDYACLDGKISFEIYKNIGIAKECQVFLTGISKMDGWINIYPNRRSISKVLICINNVDNLKIYDDLIAKINSLNILVKVREHPYQIGSLSKNLKFETCIENSIMESVKDADLVIGGDSSIHLEATLCNIPCVYFNTNPKVYDYYGFITNNLVVAYFNMLEEVIDYLKIYTPVQDVYLKAKNYCDSIDKEYENSSTDYILKKVL